MAVRLATQADILRIVDMVEDLRAAVDGPVPVDRAWTARTLAQLIDSPDGAVWVTDGGFLAASLQPTVISPERVAQEHGWFSRDGMGKALLEAFEAWAREKGARLAKLSTGPRGPDLARLGYRHAEQAWVRRL